MRPIGRLCTRNVGHGISILFLQVGSRELSSFLDMSGATSDFETNRGLWRQWRRHWKQCRSPAGHSAQGQWSGWHRGNPVQSDSNLAGHQGLSLSWKAWNMGCGFSWFLIDLGVNQWIHFKTGTLAIESWLYRGSNQAKLHKFRNVPDCRWASTKVNFRFDDPFLPYVLREAIWVPVTLTYID